MAILCKRNHLLLAFHFIYLTNFLIIAEAQPRYPFPSCQNTIGNSRFRTNLDAAMLRLPNTNNGYGFFNVSVGQGTDTANALSLCRGDVTLDDCRACLNTSIVSIRQLCPNVKQAALYDQYCLLKYSNESIFSIRDMFYDATLIPNSEFAQNVEVFFGALRPLLNNLRSDTAGGNSSLKFAMDSTIGPNFTTIYGMMQCVPNLSERDCNDCLLSEIDQLPICCDRKVGGIVLTPICNIRYEIYPFAANNTVWQRRPSPQPSPPPTLQRSPSAPPSGKSSNATRIIVIIVTVTLSVILVAAICIFGLLRKKRKQVKRIETQAMDMSTVESLQYDYETIKAATNDFSDNNKLGEGGFGIVYKGNLQNGQEVAVKKLSKNSKQGEIEFKNEVVLVAKLQHRNLVRLLGFSLEGNERLLIYDFLPNGSLDQFIFDSTKRTFINWDMRYKIIRGVARGLLYLHEDSRLRIIHRDLKASNVLLDAEMNPKIADFGMARLSNHDDTHGSTNRIVGTYGYMAPEYAMHGQFSIKSDVFSYGVLVLEIITGQKNHCFKIKQSVENLLTYAWKSWSDGTASHMIDPVLLNDETQSSLQGIMRVIHIGLLCVQNNVVERPTMASVVLMLNSGSFPLGQPKEPAFFMTGGHAQTDTGQVSIEEHHVSMTTGSENFDRRSRSSQISLNEVSTSEIVPR